VRKKAQKASPARQALIERINLAGREVSTAAIMFHSAVATIRGLSVTEEKVLDLLLREGPMTQVEIVRATGLAAPSVSQLVDRLQQREYVRRERHSDDRRRVSVVVDAERVAAEIGPLFVAWVQSLEQLYATYSDEQLETICDFMSKVADRQRKAAEELAAADVALGG
jgi:DNA-binding MarR family transcriptional regulator